MDLAKALYALVPEPFLQLTAIPPSGGAPQGKKFADLTKAARWATKQNGAGLNVYFGVNPVRRNFSGAKAKKADITSAVTCHVDVDPDVDQHGSYADARRHLLEVELPSVLEGDYPPSIVIDSGNGLGLYWRIEPTEDMDGVERVNKLLEVKHRGDNCHNIDRIMRVPGGLKNYPNAKKISKGYPKEPTTTGVLHCSDTVYTIEQMQAATADIQLPEAPITASGEAIAPPELPHFTDSRLQDRLGHDELLRERWEGNTSGLTDTSRSGFDLSLVAMLKARGFTLEDVAHLLAGNEHSAVGEKTAAGDWRYVHRMWLNSKVRTLDELVAAIKADPDVEWFRVLASYEPADDVTSDVIQALGRDENRPGVNTLKREWREFMQAEKQRKREARHDAVAAERERIYWDQTRPAHMQAEGEKALPHHSAFWFGDVLCAPRMIEPACTHAIDSDQRPPKNMLLTPHSDLSLDKLITQTSVVFVHRGEAGYQPSETPKKLTQLLREPSEQTELPRLTGIVRAPIMLGGRVVQQNGYDEGSELFFDMPAMELPTFNPEEGYRVLRDEMFGEFSFESDIDAAAAVALLITTLERKILPSAPGFLANAKQQSSGKTTLMRMVHLVATGNDLPVHAWGASPDEQRKELLATLLESPTMVCFDNLDDGTDIESGALSLAMTSTSFTGRKLGASQDVAVLTNTVFCFTGNNVTLCADMLTRVIDIRLDPRMERPDQRKYKHPEVETHCRRNRARWLGAAMAILTAEPSKAVTSRHKAWTRVVAAPLHTACGIDVLDANRRAVEDSPEVRQVRMLHQAIIAAGREGQPFTSVQFYSAHLENHYYTADDTPVTILTEFQPRNGWSVRSLGRFINRFRGRVLEGRVIGTKIIRGDRVYTLENAQ